MSAIVYGSGSGGGGGDATSTAITDALATALGSSANVESALNSLVGRAKIATGSYNGTGAYGEDNPNSLTFSFEPKIVIITLSNTTPRFGIFVKDTEYTAHVNSTSASESVHMTWNGNTVSWYNNRAGIDQFNYSSYVYHYIALS